MKHGVSVGVMVWVLGMGIVGVARGADEPDLRFRGAGSTRSALDSMQLKPFEASLLSNLSNWTGTAPKPEDLTGKPVLIVTWSNWYKVSHGAMRTAENLHQMFKDLVVIGVHNPVNPAGAVEKAKELGITFPIAEDKDGKLRAGLKADQDPNVYIVDRAGNLRYAQVDTASMEAAVAHVVAETAEQATDHPKNLAKRKADAEAARWRTRDFAGLRPNETPTVAFPEPDEEVYKTVRWPYLVGKVETDPIFERIKNDPPKINNWPDEDWVPSAPQRPGKLLLVYFVDPKDVDMLNAIPVMNRMHDKYHRDVVVACSLFKIGSGGVGNTGNDPGNDGELDKIKERNQGLIPPLLKSHPINHYVNPTILRAENLDFSGGGMIARWSGAREERVFTVLLSTDMKIRWIGTPFDPSLPIAIEKLIAVDPAVQARKKAEQAAKSK